jgi:choline dehydrogenase-like flavoprotein
VIRHSASSAAGDVFAADVCVIGSGPAGIVTALELARHGLNVIVLESGREQFSPAIQDSSEPAAYDARRHAPMNIATRRQLGGTSSLWGGRCVPFDPIDFERRAFASTAGWPLAYDEVARHYGAACKYADCGGPTFDANSAGLSWGATLVPGFEDGDVTQSSLERWSLPTRFGVAYRTAIRHSPKIRLLLDSTCVGFERDAPRRAMRAALVKNNRGGALRVQARAFVIAAGGLESTRLLLSDEFVAHAAARTSDALGRYYMGHVSGKVADIEFTTDPKLTIFGFERDADGVYCRRRLAVSAERQRKEGLLNTALWLDNPPLYEVCHRNGILSAAYLALSTPVVSRALAAEAIRRAAVGGTSPTQISKHLENIVRDFPATAIFLPAFAWKRFVRKRKIPGFFLRSHANRYALHYHGEQTPNPHSRVSLSQSRDSYGLRRLRISLCHSDVDFDSVIRTHEIVGSWVKRLEIGRLEWRVDDPLQSVRQQAGDGFHQIGTTRMADTESHGVVDRDCALFATPNVFVASSSVFPTSGQANPVLTTLALSIRLADHIARTLAKPFLVSCTA